MTSANSINVALVASTNLLCFGLETMVENPFRKSCNLCSKWNFGNICAGILAHHRGLPVEHFIAACNVNDVVPEYLRTEILQPKETVATISNAMDVGDQVIL